MILRRGRRPREMAAPELIEHIDRVARRVSALQHRLERERTALLQARSRARVGLEGALRMLAGVRTR